MQALAGIEEAHLGRRGPRRPQGRQHHPRPAPRRDRRGQDRRLRDRAAGHRRARRGPLDQRHARVHGARGDQRLAAELRVGHLRGRHHPVRAAGLQDAVLRRLDDRDPRQPPEGDGAVAVGAPRAGAQGARGHRRRGRSPSTPTTGSRRPPTCGPRWPALATRAKRVPTRDICAECGTTCAPSFKFCPECGTPRQRVEQVLPPPQPAAPAEAAGRVLPLQFTGRADELGQLLAHMRRAPGKDVGLLVMGNDGSGRSALLRHAYQQLAADTRTIYQIGPDPTGLAAPFYPIRSLLAAVLQLPPVSSDAELRDAVLAAGLNERDVPGISQLFGHSTTLLELEPPVRRREMVWSALRALERAAVAGPVTIVCEDIDRFDHPSLEILRRATEMLDLQLPPIVMTAHTSFGSQWPAVGAAPGGRRARRQGPRRDRRAARQGRAQGPAAGPAAVRDHPGLPRAPRARRALPARGRQGRGHQHLAARPDRRAAVDAQAVDPRRAAGRRRARPRAPGRPACARCCRATRWRPRWPTPSAPGCSATTRRASSRSPAGWSATSCTTPRRPTSAARSTRAAAAAVETLSPDVALLGHHHDLAGHAKEAIMLLRRAGDHAAEQLDDIGAGQFYYRALVAVRQAVLSGDDDGSAEGQFVRAVGQARRRAARARRDRARPRRAGRGARLVGRADAGRADRPLQRGDRAQRGRRRGRDRQPAARRRPGDLDRRHEPGVRALPRPRRPRCCAPAIRPGRSASWSSASTSRRSARASPRSTARSRSGGSCGRRPRWSTTPAIPTGRCGWPRPRCSMPSACGRGSAPRGSSTCSHSCAKRPGSAARPSAIARPRSREMRGLGDRRATAELLLNDAPAKPAVAPPGRVDDAMQLTQEIGWSEGRGRREAQVESALGQVVRKIWLCWKMGG